jgi:hypothetical protein
VAATQPAMVLSRVVFAHAVAAEDADHLAAVGFEIDALDDMAEAVVGVQPCNLQQHQACPK